MNRFLLVPFIMFLLFYAACSDPDSDSELNYTLRIVNDFGVSLNVYLEAGNLNEGFQDKGIIPTQGEILVNNMVVGVTYILRGVEVGGTVDNWVFEEEFVNNSSSTPRLTVTIR